MRASKAIGLYFAAVILAGAALAPWLFWTVQQLAHRLPALQGYATYPFHRVFDRSILLVALAGLWPLLRTLGFRFWSDAGYVRSPRWWRHVLTGFVIGIGSLTVLIAFLIILRGHRLTITRTPAQMTGAVVRFFLAGGVIALIEETLFRGALQGALQRRLNVALAVVVTSTVYSAVHFLKPNGVNISADQVTWASGGKCLVWIVTQSMRQKGMAIQFVSLFLAGCVLGLAYARTKALYLSIGLHAGWVVANEFMRWLATLDVTQDVASWPMLVALLVLMVWLCPTIFKPLRGPGSSSSGPAVRST